MKCSLGISNFLEEISVFPILLFSSISLHWSLREAFLSLLVLLWNCIQMGSVQGSHCRVQLFATPWTAAHQAPLSITNYQSLHKLLSIELMMPSNHLILCRPFSHLQCFPTLGSFQVSQLFASGGQSIGVSASVLPMNTQDWSPIGWTGWNSLQSKDSQESSPTPQFKSIKSSAFDLGISFLFSFAFHVSSFHSYL